MDWKRVLTDAAGPLIAGLLVPLILVSLPPVRRWLINTEHPLRSTVLASAVTTTIASVVIWLVLPRAHGGPDFPKGAIVSSRQPCDASAGWIPFLEGTGRFFVGAGNQYAPGFENWNLDVGDDKTQAIALSKTAFAVMQSGGEMKHELLRGEIPLLNLSIQLTQHNDYQRDKNGYVGTETVGQPVQRNDIPGPGGSPHNVMPPFIALYYCQKN